MHELFMLVQQAHPNLKTWHIWFAWVYGVQGHLLPSKNYEISIYTLIYVKPFFLLSHSYYFSFNDFIQSIEKRGIGAMEIVAMDMKLRGMYMARQLSFSGVSFKIEEIKLKNEYVKMYDDAVKLV